MNIVAALRPKVRSKSLASLALAVCLAGLTLAACQRSPSGPEIVISEAWGQPLPASAANGAIYMQIRNRGDQPDTLLSASSPVCSALELHETEQENDIASMHLAHTGLPISAGQVVELKPAGLHLMCVDKQADFRQGAAIPLSLEFEKSGAIALEASIRLPP